MSCNQNTLSEVVDQYLIRRGVNNKKNYSKFLIIAETVWQQLFQNTIWVTKEVWVPLKAGDPYPYLDLPEDCARLFGVNTVDDCGRVIPLFYDNTINVLVKPQGGSSCGCGTCDCGGMCEDLNSMTVTTKEMFTVGDVTYYEKTWLKFCSNGDVLEYREVPTKKYNDKVGDAGDYSEDYNEDYNTSTTFANFQVVTETFQRKLCALEVSPCGCPVNSEVNSKLIDEFCGCYLPCSSRRKGKYCKQYFADPNSNHKGSVKLSECGTKIYYRPAKQCDPCNDKDPMIPDFLLVNYQTNGKNFDSQIKVPDYAKKAMWFGIDYESKVFNSSYSMNEKEMARISFEREQSNIIKFLNPISLQWLSDVQDEPIKW